ncbi:MAG: hypothetical protein V1645_01065 [archaeon]
MYEEEDIYMEEYRSSLLEDDEISAEEEGFMIGYEDSFDFSF